MIIWSVVNQRTFVIAAVLAAAAWCDIPVAGATAGSTGADPVLTDGARAVAAAAVTQERSSASDASPAALRERSRVAFRRLSSTAARQALVAEHPELVARPGWLGRLAAPVIAATRPLGPNVLRVKGALGMDSVVLTSQPIAFRSPSGAFREIDLSLRRIGDELVPRSSPVGLSLPSSLDESIGVGAGERRFSINPVVSDGGEVALEQYAAFYGNVDQDTDFVVKPVLGGVETFSILRSPASPESFKLRVSAEPDFHLRESGAGGYVLTDGTGELVSIGVPRAWDAENRPVPLTTVVQGDGLVLGVSHRDEDFTYPIVVDPVVVDTCWANVIANSGCQVDAWESDPSPTYNTGTAGWAFEGPAGGRFAPYAGPGYLGAGLYIRNLVQNYYWAGEAGDWYFRAPPGVRIWSALFTNLSQDNLPDNTSCLFVGVLENTGAWGSNSPRTFCSRQAFDQTFTWCPGVNCSDRSGGTPGNAAIFGAMAQRTGWSNYWMDHMGGVALAMTEMNWPSLNPYVSSPDFPDDWQTDPARVITFHMGDAGLGLKGISFSSPENPGWEAIDADTGGPATRAYNSCTGGTRLACPKDVWIRVRLGELQPGFSTIRVKATDVVGKTYTYEHPIAIQYHWAAMRFGGVNGSVDNADEVAQVVDAMAARSASARQALWAGLDQASKSHYVESLLAEARFNRRAFGLNASDSATRSVFAEPTSHGTIAELGMPLTAAEDAFVSDESSPSWVHDGAPDQYVLAPDPEPDTPAQSPDEAYPGELDGPSGQDSTIGFGCDPSLEAGCPTSGIRTDDPGTVGSDVTDDYEAVDAAAAITAATTAGASGGGFSRYGVVADAYAHALEPRTGLFAPVGESDCTNFVSQVWHLGGGLPMKRGWYIREVTRWTPGIPIRIPYKIRISSYSWTLVRNFVDYMVNLRQTARLINASPGAPRLPSGTGYGDAVEYDWGMGHGWSHLAVVVGLSGPYHKISQHSTNRRESSWRRGWFDQPSVTIRQRMRARVVHVRAR